MLRLMKRGQSAVEYIVLMTLVLGAFLMMQNYFKRGIQGRWKAGIDGLGDQYDPRVANIDMRFTANSLTQTTITTINGTDGLWTQRFDVSNSTDRKVGSQVVGFF